MAEEVETQNEHKKYNAYEILKKEERNRKQKI